jgi:coenzyme F420 hydrogenase subunit beta
MTAQPDRPSVTVGELYAGYACDESVRAGASSGGIVSAVLIHLLQAGHDGALVSRIAADGATVAVTNVARSVEEVLDHAGSSYIDSPVLGTIDRLCESGALAGRRYAVVALPCQVRALRNRFLRRPELNKALNPIIGLFCRGNVKPVFYDDLLAREGIDPARVRSVRVRRGHVKGCVELSLSDGRQRRLAFGHLNAYRILGVHAKDLCAWCDEHLADQADLSVGDIFLPEFKKLPIKHSAFVARNAAAAALAQTLIDEGRITCCRVGMDEYRRRFRRMERFSNDLASRRLAARLVGRKAPRGKLPGRFSIFRCLAWTIIFLHGRMSQRRWARRCLYAMPRWWIGAWALAVKALSRL